MWPINWTIAQPQAQNKTHIHLALYKFLLNMFAVIIYIMNLCLIMFNPAMQEDMIILMLQYDVTSINQSINQPINHKFV